MGNPTSPAPSGAVGSACNSPTRTLYCAHATTHPGRAHVPDPGGSDAQPCSGAYSTSPQATPTCLPRCLQPVCTRYRAGRAMHAQGPAHTHTLTTRSALTPETPRRPLEKLTRNGRSPDATPTNPSRCRLAIASPRRSPWLSHPQGWSIYDKQARRKEKAGRESRRRGG